MRFFMSLDRRRWSQACSLLAKQFYRRNHVPDRRQCIAGFRIGMGGWALKYRIGHANGSRNAVVDGAPGTVRLIRERHGYRVLAMQGDTA